MKKALDEENIAYCLCGGVVANPLLSKVNEGIQICKEEGVDFILAVGGGSVLDSSKGLHMVFIMKVMSGIITQERKR